MAVWCVKSSQQQPQFLLECQLIFSWPEGAGVCRIAPSTNGRLLFFYHLHKTYH